MPKTVSISWLKQKSGNFALKGITIYKDAQAFDSMSTFRDEDARWLTKMLGAQPHIEISGSGMAQRSSDNYPAWALDMENQGTDVVGALPLDWERAGATLLRHLLTRIVEQSAKGPQTAQLQALVEESKAALAATDAGTYFNLDEASTVLERRAQQAAKTRKKA